MKILIVLISYDTLGISGEKTGFWIEDALIKHGALCSKGKDWKSYIKQDGLLISGQNPAFSVAVENYYCKY